MSFIVLNCQVVEWVDNFANPVFKHPDINCIEITKEQLYIRWRSVKCFSRFSHTCMFFVGSSFGKKSTFLGIIILIFFLCVLGHCRVMTGYYVTLKYKAKSQNYCLKNVSNFKVTRFYLILLCNNILGPQALIQLL